MMKAIGAIPYVPFLTILSLLVFTSIAVFGIYPYLDADRWWMVIVIPIAATVLGTIFGLVDVRTRKLPLLATLAEVGDAINRNRATQK
jgi:ribose/xylose/arabinose/galactoside ABC-type transport system permease subunit